MTIEAGSERLNRLTRSFYLDQGERVEQLKQKGMDVFRLDIGSPDLPPPPEVVRRLSQTASLDHTHGYQAHIGPLELRLAWADAYRRWFDVTLAPSDQIQPLIGSKEGIFNLTQALVDPGQVVLVPDPGYPTYAESAQFTGAEVVRMPLTAGSQWLPDPDSLDTATLDRTRLLWLNYPNNPTGAICPLSLFEQIVELAHHHGFLVCHDAAYCQVTYDGYQAPSILQVPGAVDVAVEFNSLSKTYNMAGWRMGVLVGSSAAVAALRMLKAQSESGHFLPAIQAGVAALSSSGEWVTERNLVYRNRRDALISVLRTIPNIEFEIPQAGMYMWVKLNGEDSSFSYSIDLMQATGVCTAPGAIYGSEGEGHVRISLAAPEEALLEAASRWKKWEAGR